jgi:hypothetical protein
MRPLSWWSISVGAMAFGRPGVAVLGASMFTILIGVTILALLFHVIRYVVRGAWRRLKPVKVNECSQELLDYWTGSRVGRSAPQLPPG